MVAEVLGSLQAQTEFLAPGFDLSQANLLQALEKSPRGGKISLSLSFCLSLSYYPMPSLLLFQI